MIHLDSHLLIALVDAGDPHRENALRLMEVLPQAAACSLAWWEFECGPVSPQGLAMVPVMLPGGILPFGGEVAREAARLFNPKSEVSR